MAAYTSRLNLTKPSAEEMADISVINNNMDKIDAGVVLKAGDTMTGDLTIEAFIKAALGNVPTAVCNIGTDLNNATAPGFYMYTGSYSNVPSSAGGSLIVTKYNDNIISQLAFSNSSSKNVNIWARHFYLDGWSDWSSLTHGNVDYPYKRGTILNTTATTSTANQWVNTGLTVTLTSNHIYAIGSSYAYGTCLGIQLRTSAGTYTAYEHIAETGGAMLSCMPVFFCQSGGTYQLWVKRGATGENSYQVFDLGAVVT